MRVGKGVLPLAKRAKAGTSENLRLNGSVALPLFRKLDACEMANRSAKLTLKPAAMCQYSTPAELNVGAPDSLLISSPKRVSLMSLDE
jgi:hypothetical protein